MVFKKIENFYFRKALENRAKAERSIPQTKLTSWHIEDCELVLDRAALLRRFGEGGQVAELGVNAGDFSHQILNTNCPSCLYLVDVWESERYSESLLKSVIERFHAEMTANQVRIVRQLSTDAASAFRDQFFDWVYVDTDHTYETTRAELEAFSSKIKPGGLIAGHDYSLGNWIKSFRYGVIEAVHEFCFTRDWRLRYLTVDIPEGRSFAIQKPA